MPPSCPPGQTEAMPSPLRTVAEVAEAHTELVDQVEELAGLIRAAAKGMATGGAASAGHAASLSPAMESHWQQMLAIERGVSDGLRREVADLRAQLFDAKLAVVQAEQLAMAAGGSNEVKMEVVKQAGRIADLVKLKVLADAKGPSFKPQGTAQSSPITNAVDVLAGSKAGAGQDDSSGDGGQPDASGG